MKRRWWWQRLKRDTLERVAFFVAIVGFPLLLISTGAVLYQFVEVRHIASSQNHIQLSILFFRNANTEIIDAIEISAIDGKTQILQDHGGKYTNTRLDNYLGDFDIVDQVYRERLLTEDEMCRTFSYYVIATLKNEEIKRYMANNLTYFDGIRDLETAVEKSKSKNCRAL
jgi:hypothetical protein